MSDTEEAPKSIRDRIKAFEGSAPALASSAAPPPKPPIAPKPPAPVTTPKPAVSPKPTSSPLPNPVPLATEAKLEARPSPTLLSSKSEAMAPKPAASSPSPIPKTATPASKPCSGEDDDHPPLPPARPSMDTLSRPSTDSLAPPSSPAAPVSRGKTPPPPMPSRASKPPSSPFSSATPAPEPPPTPGPVTGVDTPPLPPPRPMSTSTSASAIPPTPPRPGSAMSGPPVPRRPGDAASVATLPAPPLPRRDSAQSRSPARASTVSYPPRRTAGAAGSVPGSVSRSMASRAPTSARPVARTGPGILDSVEWDFTVSVPSAPRWVRAGEGIPHAAPADVDVEPKIKALAQVPLDPAARGRYQKLFVSLLHGESQTVATTQAEKVFAYSKLEPSFLKAVLNFVVSGETERGLDEDSFIRALHLIDTELLERKFSVVDL